MEIGSEIVGQKFPVLNPIPQILFRGRSCVRLGFLGLFGRPPHGSQLCSKLSLSFLLQTVSTRLDSLHLFLKHGGVLAPPALAFLWGFARTLACPSRGVVICATIDTCDDTDI